MTEQKVCSLLSAVDGFSGEMQGQQLDESWSKEK